MGELLLSQSRPTGPRVVVISAGGAGQQYQAVGIVEHSPLFLTRQEAEAWLRKHLAKMPQSKRPQVRSCMRCRSEFQSEGFHNRMCGPCRHVAEGVDGSPYRVIRPSKRG